MNYRLLALLAVAALPITLLGDDAFVWRSIEVEMSLEPDGALAIREKVEVEVPEDGGVIKRRYWTDSDEHVTPLRVKRIDRNEPVRFEFSPWGELRWTVPAEGEGPQRLRYEIDSRVTGVTIPVWGIRRGVRKNDPHEFLANPLDRLQEIVSLWRDGGPDPRRRYLLDYQYFFPDEQQRFNVQPTLSLSKEWKSVHPIKADPDSFRISHVLDYTGAGTPSSIDVRSHLIRVGSILAFPLLAFFVLLAYFGWVYVRRKRIAEIDERWLRERLFNEYPEVIRAQWTGRVSVLNIETILRRMEREGKLTIVVQVIKEGTDDEETIVTLTLRVPRDRFSEYERRIIDSLIPKGDEVSSREIERRHAGTDFDPTDEAEKWLATVAKANVGTVKSPLLSRAVSFALFAAGMGLLALETIRLQRAPTSFFLTLPIIALLVSVWPSRRMWIRAQQKPAAMLLLLIPLALMCAGLAVIHTTTEQPVGIYGSVGVVLALLGAFHALVADAGKKGKKEKASHIADLIAAEAWMRRTPRVYDDWIPYIEALGLGPERKSMEANEEHWGSTLYTWADLDTTDADSEPARPT